MTEQHNTTPSPGSGWRGHAGAIARTITAVAAGAAVGYSTHNVGLGVTTAAATVSLLREAFTRPAP
jgi:hypothetical protein